MKNVRHYPPFTNDGAYHDFLDELHHAGADVTDLHPAHATWHGAKYALASDEDTFRIQLLATGDGGESTAWSQIERVHEPWMSSVHGDDANMIEGDDTKTFGPFTEAQAQAMLAKVKSQGMSVTGNNPWHVDTNTHGVKFDATFDGSHVTIKITGSNFYVSNAKVWDKIDPLMNAAKNISGDDGAIATKSAASKTPGVKVPSALDKQEGSALSLGLLLMGIFAIVVFASRE
jgi:hypothetical protein